MREEIGWLALGAALGSTKLLARLLAEVSPAAFTPAQRQLLAALGRGRESVRVLLEALGVPVATEQTAADAILDRAKEHGEREAQRTLAHQVSAAARLLPPDEFRAWLAQRANEYMTPEARRAVQEADPQAAAGKALAGPAERNGVPSAGSGPVPLP